MCLKIVKWREINDENIRRFLIRHQRTMDYDTQSIVDSKTELWSFSNKFYILLMSQDFNSKASDRSIFVSKDGRVYWIYFNDGFILN